MPGVPDYENRSEEEVAEASQAGSQAGLFNELIAQLVQVHQQALSDQAALREEVLRLQDPSDGRTKSEESSQIPPSTVSHPKDDRYAPDVADDFSSSSDKKVSPVEDQVQGVRSSAASIASIASMTSMTSMTSMITRPPNQPPKFPIRPGWLKEPKHSTVQRHRQTTYDLEGRSSVVDGDDSPDCCIPVPVCHPSANVRIAWDLFGALLIAYDAVYLPFDAAFQPKPNLVILGMDWLTMLFWTFDIAVGFLTGFIRKGEVVMNPSQIALHYISTWFIIDAAVVGFDWFSTIQSSTSEVGDFGRIFRTLRTVRMLRLLRLWKLKRVLADMQDMIDSEYLYTLASLGKLLGFILIINHLIACVWFSVSVAMRESGTASWVAEHNMSNKGVGWQYATSLHWTLTQFTPASMEVFPENVTERAMAVVVLIFSLVAFSSFLASISASMTALRNQSQETTKQFWILRRFLKQEQIAKPVVGKVLKYVEHCHAQQIVRIQPENVMLLTMLSVGLREELHYELTYTKMVSHPLIRILVAEQEMFMVKICTAATSTRTMAPTETLFHPGEAAHHMYFMVHGDLAYILQDESPISPPISKGEALAEAALWLPWFHSGTSFAQIASEVLVMDPLIFGTVAARYIATWRMCSKFAHLFQEAFMEVGPSDVFRKEDFYDIAVNSLNKEDLLVSRFSLMHRVRIISSGGTNFRWSMPRWTRQTKRDMDPSMRLTKVDSARSLEMEDMEDIEDEEEDLRGEVF